MGFRIASTPTLLHLPVLLVQFLDDQAIDPVSVEFLFFQTLDKLQQTILQFIGKLVSTSKSSSVTCPATRYACNPDTLSPREPNAMLR